MRHERYAALALAAGDTCRFLANNHLETGSHLGALIHGFCWFVDRIGGRPSVFYGHMECGVMNHCHSVTGQKSRSHRIDDRAQCCSPTRYKTKCQYVARCPLCTHITVQSCSLFLGLVWTPSSLRRRDIRRRCSCSF